MRRRSFCRWQALSFRFDRGSAQYQRWRIKPHNQHLKADQQKEQRIRILSIRVQRAEHICLGTVTVA
ncbi:hypothetical protein X760_20450 [Mesorhizobium sp. LSHC422A00]|nr:hypothetical protein X768_18585 [Mesorhizobium sp. LSJC265A00]ESX58376.1 hypothetical protein X760_20450 [Mesorhizobium sp. LSHC422A00]ESZ46011.1 hypothetical protein X730_24020 [Mesorhizobium sp. L103C565B0]